MIYDQKKEGESLWSFGENIESWDRLNQASASLENENETGPSDRERLDSLVLKEETDTVGFLSHVDELGKQTGVIVSASELKVEKTAERGFNNIAATFSLRGSRDSVENMIELLELLPYRSHIETMTLTRTDEVSEAVVELMVSVIE